MAELAEKPKKYEADDGMIDIDMGDHEAAEVEVEDSSPQPLRASENEVEEQVSSAQKRINQLTKKMRDMERREQEAIRYAQQVQQEAQTLKQRVNQLDHGFMTEYGSRLDIETQNAEALLRRAVEVGDAEKTVEAQRALTRLYNQKEQYEQAVVAQQRQAEMQRQQVQNTEYQRQVAQQQVAQRAPQPIMPDAKATKWAEKNEWFGQDEAMTFAAFGIHKKLVEDEGFDPKSDEYYNELDKRLSRRFPELGGEAAQNSGSSKRSVQTVAGVSRSTVGGNTSGRKRVKLTPTQVAIANKLGVPLEEYAKYVKE